MEASDHGVAVSMVALAVAEEEEASLGELSSSYASRCIVLRWIGF